MIIKWDLCNALWKWLRFWDSHLYPLPIIRMTTKHQRQTSLTTYCSRMWDIWLGALPVLAGAGWAILISACIAYMGISWLSADLGWPWRAQLWWLHVSPLGGELKRVLIMRVKYKSRVTLMAQAISGKSLLVSHLLLSHWPKQAQSLNERPVGSHTVGVWIQVKKGHMSVICHRTQLGRMGRVRAEVRLSMNWSLFKPGKKSAWGFIILFCLLFHNRKVNQKSPSSSIWEA